MNSCSAIEATALHTIVTREGKTMQHIFAVVKLKHEMTPLGPKALDVALLVVLLCPTTNPWFLALHPTPSPPHCGVFEVGGLDCHHCGVAKASHSQGLLQGLLLATLSPQVRPVPAATSANEKKYFQ